MICVTIMYQKSEPSHVLDLLPCISLIRALFALPKRHSSFHESSARYTLKDTHKQLRPCDGGINCHEPLFVCSFHFCLFACLLTINPHVYSCSLLCLLHLL